MITPIYKARVLLVWEGLYSITSTPQMLVECPGGNQASLKMLPCSTFRVTSLLWGDEPRVLGATPPTPYNNFGHTISLILLGARLVSGAGLVCFVFSC